MELTTEMMMVMAMIVVAVFLFIVEWIRVDVVAILMMVSLPLLGLVTPTEAFIGLSSNAVVSIIAVIIIGAGLDKTGAINRLVEPVLKVAGNSQSRVIMSISMTVAIISSFLQNIGAAALFLPALKRVSNSMKIPMSRILMPVGFSAILGGTVTMVGSSPLILLNDLLKPFDLEPFGLFAVAPIGLSLVVSGIAFFVIFGRYVFPQGDGGEGSGETGVKGDIIDDYYGFLGTPFELETPEGWKPSGEDNITITMIRRDYLVNIVAMVGSDREVRLAPKRGTALEAGQTLGVFGTEENVEKFVDKFGLTLKRKLDVFRSLLSPIMSGTVEAVISPHSEMAGKTFMDFDFRKRYNVMPMAIYRSKDEIFKTDLSQVSLKVGDAVLVHGSWERLKILEKNPNFIFTTPVTAEVMRPEKAYLSVFWLAVALSMVIFFDIQLSVSLMTGALGIIITRVLSIDEAYKAVDWRTVFLLAGLIPLGIATQKSGAATWIAQAILGFMGDISPLVLFTMIAILSTAFTLVISNVGATVLLVPLVINMAMEAGADPRMAALVVGIAVSNSFILPTHQVNALYMGPGRYRSIDFIKAGSVTSILFIVVMITVMYLFYGIGG
ncbi:MAG: SLC13 family permease [Candidatus Desulfatibia sp.]|uniref:SLC13 family permease n=1 Tax=Candidatus Desulfatibia sp. TaxID=3101189 RepID=UPI002F2E98D3